MLSRLVVKKKIFLRLANVKKDEEDEDSYVNKIVLTQKGVFSNFFLIFFIFIFIICFYLLFLF